MSEFNEEENGYGEVPAIESDFNVEDDFVPEPLIPMGTYHGSVVNVKFSPSDQTIVWTFCLANNGGLMSDGETSVDGVTIDFKNWLPKEEDKAAMAKNNRQTKWQSKINMLHNFAEGIGIVMKDGAQILGAIADSTWVGMDVDLDIKITEWQGKFRNEVGRVKKSTI